MPGDLTFSLMCVLVKMLQRGGKITLVEREKRSLRDYHEEIN
jgi:hypothetical protein